jgi:hypothetical protein
MDDLRSQIRHALIAVQSEAKWRPGSATGHLLKRKVRGHLDLSATLSDYQQIIATVVNDKCALVFVYWHEQVPYPTVVATVQGHSWLVMCDLDGTLESAFVVERPDHYLNRTAFQLLGTLGEMTDDEPRQNQ